jgi:hypothetical protein
VEGAAVWMGGLSEVSVCVAAFIEYCRASKNESPTPIVHTIRIVKAVNGEAISLSKRPPATQKEQSFIPHPIREFPDSLSANGNISPSGLLPSARQPHNTHHQASQTHPIQSTYPSPSASPPQTVACAPSLEFPHPHIRPPTFLASPHTPFPPPCASSSSPPTRAPTHTPPSIGSVSRPRRAKRASPAS